MHKYLKIISSLGYLTLILSGALAAEEPKFSLAKTAGLPDSVTIDGSLRTRYEYADWFNAGKEGVNNNDSYSSLKSQLGVGYQQKEFKLYVQGEYDQIFDLRKNVDAGVSSAYRSFNNESNNPGNVYIRQGYVKFPAILGSGLDLQAGRFLYRSGDEVNNDDPTLKWLKQNRISERLIGAFDFTFGRSFDGGRADYAIDDIGTLTLSAFHPTEGGFRTNGMESISNISVLTSVFTKQFKASQNNQSELQFFYYRYNDDRNVVKTDNRSLDIRRADLNEIAINNYGAHLVQATKLDMGSLGMGTWESVFWGVLQEGHWGENHHVAQAYAAETGYQFNGIYSQPWIRTGLNWGSGDRNSTDGKHGTFFQMLTTSRIYAMTPFYNMMNMQDFFVQGILKPFEKVSVRSDVHFLNTVSSNDSFYSGAGAGSRNGAFGFGGVPANGLSSVGTLFDGGISYQVNQYLGLNLYYGYLVSGSLPQKTFTKQDNVKYGFGEINLKF